METIHPEQFRRCVTRYSGNYKVRDFTCWDQFLAMAFAQMTFRESLMDIEICEYSGDLVAWWRLKDKKLLE